MSRPKRQKRKSGLASIVEYARERYRLAGGQTINDYDPFFLPIDEWHTSVALEGQKALSFAHYDYLGLNGHPTIEAAATSILRAHGTSVSASRLVGGERGFHRDLDHALAAFLSREAAVSLVSGFLTNVTLLNHIVGRRDLVLYDEFSHNSIITGLATARAHSVAFPHNDLRILEEILTDIRGQYRRCLIVVESLYSMDGDIADLPQLIAIKRRHDCWLMVDEAHSIGVLGKTGRGISEHFNTDPADIDVQIGTLSKAFVSCGGFLAAQTDVIRWLKYTLPGFVFSVGMSPPSAGAALAAIGIATAEPNRVARLQSVSELFVSEARQRNLNTGSAIGCGVVPVLFDSDAEAICVSSQLKKEGIYAPPIVRIGVPKDKPRIRFFLSARHAPDDVRRALSIVADSSTSRLPRDIGQKARSVTGEPHMSHAEISAK